ncbi:exosortase family protein XrtM [Oxalobacteraceae bacterium GrIS 2.11]
MRSNKNNVLASTRLIGLFILVFVLQYLLYFYVPDEVLINRIYYDLIVLPAMYVINAIFPAEQAFGLANSIHSAKVDLEVVRGCDGSGLLFLLEAAIVVFPAPIKRKLSGAALAIFFVYVLNLLRIVILFYAASFQPMLFQSLHSFYLPTLLIALTGMFFYTWAPIHARQ